MESVDTSFLLMAAAGLLATGAVAGVLAGLLGVGGGIVIVPVLFYLFGFLGVPETTSMHLAVATSLATIVPTSISSTRAHHARGVVDFAVLRRWAPFILLGSATGGLLAGFMQAETLTLVFATVATLVAINMMIPGAFVIADRLPERLWPQGMLGASIGFISALMGIGGGTLSVPALTLFGYPAHRAVGTAAAFGFVIAVPAAIGFMIGGAGAPARPPGSIGFVNLPAAVMIFSMSVLTAPLGSRLAHWLPPRRLKIAFAVFLIITAARMLRGVLLD